jgi:hypothetical protein
MSAGRSRIWHTWPTLQLARRIDDSNFSSHRTAYLPGPCLARRLASIYPIDEWLLPVRFGRPGSDLTCIQRVGNMDILWFKGFSVLFFSFYLSVCLHCIVVYVLPVRQPYAIGQEASCLSALAILYAGGVSRTNSSR